MTIAILRLGLLVSLVSGLISPGGQGKGKQPPTILPAANAPLVTTDRFGYQMDDTVSVDWVDATVGGTKLVFTDTDDGYASVNFGFPFKFYENSYSQLFASTNGLITFGVESKAMENYPIPWDSLPNNYIAPLWDDLSLVEDVAVPGRGVYWKLLGTSGSYRLIIEWYRVMRHGPSTAELTFEAILYQNGDIDLLYYTLDGDVTKCTVGIEDSDGLDGLQYVYYSPGLSVGKEIRFDRPDPHRRVKILPRYTSNFAVNSHADYQLVVKNNGDSGSDTYNLQVNPGSVDWYPSLNKANGQILPDSNLDGIQDTGPLVPGQVMTISMQLNTSSVLDVGAFTRAVITATSIYQSNVWMTATAQAAVPGAFVQVYFDAEGLQLRQVWNENVVNQRLTNYTGDTLLVGNIDSNNYLVAWERHETSQPFGEVEYQIVSRLGSKLQNPLILTNSGELLQHPVVRSIAQHPVVAKSPNGQVGVVWQQYLENDKYQWYSNVRLAVLNSNGTRISDRFDLINDTSFYSGTVNTHEYTSPFLAASVNNLNQSRFFACWIDIFRESAPGRRVTCGISTFDGTQINRESPFNIEEVTGSGLSLNEPYLIPLGSDRILVAYTRQTGSGASIVSEIVYAVRNINGTEIKAPTTITGASGNKVRALEFPNGDVLMLWVTLDGKPGYIILEGANNYNPPAGDPNPKTLPYVENRPVVSLSATLDQSGAAQLTWLDAETRRHLYYLILAQDGSIVTPGMQFIFPILGTSNYGQGIASYLGVHQNFLPLLGKLAH